MEAEEDHNRKKIKGGCGFLSFMCGCSPQNPANKSIPKIDGKSETLTPPPPKEIPLQTSGHRRQSSQENGSQLVVHKRTKPVLAQGNSLSGELDMMIMDYQKAKGSSNLVRVSSGNVMVNGQLGNIWGMNNARSTAEGKAPVLCRDLSEGMDPEKVKEMGNEEFRAGRLSAALALYDRAIMLDSSKASYWNNKAAVLARMGRLIEAITGCKEAVRIDQSYSRAHHRLGTLYLRLGEAEKAVYHYKQSRGEADSDDLSRAIKLQMHIIRSSEARKRNDWQNMLEESQSALACGADSAPKVFSSQAEALLKLGSQEEADSVLKSSPKFSKDAIINFFGSPVIEYIYMIQAEVDLASGRFDEAVTFIRRVGMDQNNREINAVITRIKAVVTARDEGNEFFKASKYSEACDAYGQGLHLDPFNAILLCNQAACHMKLQQWAKAIEECNTVLDLRPSYTKARLRRADCFVKLKEWEAAAQDYLFLVREFPGDDEVARSLLNAQSHLQRKSKCQAVSKETRL